MGKKIVSVACYNCNSNQARKLENIKGYVIYRCRRCSFVFVHPQVGLEETEKVYDSPQYYALSIVQRGRIEWDIQRRLKILRELRPKKGRILDVGCAAGYFLSAAMIDGWDVLGIERSTHTASRAVKMVGGGQVKACTFEDVSHDGLFDAICFWEVLEHIQQPLKSLNKAVSMLAPNGLICLSTPNISGFLSHFMGKKFPALMPPEHLSYFNYKSIRYLLNRFGLREIVVKSFSNIGKEEFYNGIVKYYLGNLKINRSKTLRIAAYAVSVLFSPFIKIIDKLNLGSELEVYAELKK